MAIGLEQLDSILEEMGRYGFSADHLVINNVIKEIGGSSFLQARADQQRGYIERLYQQYSGMKIVEVPLFPHEIKGLERLRKVGEYLFAGDGG